MPNKSGLGYVDYVLFGDDGVPLAVIEAKKTGVDPRVGKNQAKLYADCLEKQYNFRPLIFYTNGFQYYMWDDTSYPEREVSGIFTKNDLDWLIYKKKNQKPLKSVYIRDEITNRVYQKMAIQAVCDTLQLGHRKSLLVMATGSGKTRVSISTVDVLANKGWVKNVLFLADRRELVKQAKKNFKAHMPNLCFRISSSIRLIFFHIKRIQSSNLNSITICKCLSHFIKKYIHNFSCFILLKSCFIFEPLDQFKFVQLKLLFKFKSSLQICITLSVIFSILLSKCYKS